MDTMTPEERDTYIRNNAEAIDRARRRAELMLDAPSRPNMRRERSRIWPKLAFLLFVAAFVLSWGYVLSQLIK